MAEITDKKLAEIQDELMKKLDKDEMEEEEIEEKSSAIAAALMMNPVVKAEINGSLYTFKFRTLKSTKVVDKKTINIELIFLIIADDTKFKIVGSKYKPFTATAEIIESMTMQENLRGVVNSFIRHITGKIKPEVLE